MSTRLISTSKSEVRKMSAMELKRSIQASEGRVVLSQCYVGSHPLLEGTTNPELAEAFGADMVFFNGYPMDDSKIPAFQGQVNNGEGWEPFDYRLKEMKELTNGPLGIYLECGAGDDPTTSTSQGKQLVRTNRIASEENLKKLLDEEADFVVLAGNPGTGTKLEDIVEATRLAKKVLGDEVMIWSGKWEDGVDEKVLGDPLATFDHKDIISKLIDAGADVICLPMPGSRTGITVDMIRDLVEFTHRYKPGTLAMSFLDGSVEGADEDTIRLCTLMSKQTGADIHAIGDAGCSGMSTPENIYQMAITLKGRRLTWYKLASGKR
ncbi:hypothetical protein R2F61_05630 [Mollicutes bacterium LVI A0078]|nr:hypothetical protein RZE84_05645 [Mollicutes bacterium LVI A0075]WOO90210.1 hypothetical protein R2F61_05630 [Mollicutes bacterium LVI A0078]